MTSSNTQAEGTTGKKYNIGMSLDSFMAAYTSEDNASFSEILEKQNAERRQKYAWIYEKDERKLLLDNPARPLMIEGSKSFPVDQKGLIEGWNYKAYFTFEV